MSGPGSKSFSPIWWAERVGGFLIGFLFSSNIISFIGKLAGWAQNEAFPSLINIVSNASMESKILSTLLIGMMIILAIKTIIMVGHFITYCIVGGIIAGIVLPMLIDWTPINLGHWIMDQKILGIIQMYLPT